MSCERKLAEADRREQIAPIERDGAMQDSVRLCVVRRVAGLSRTLQVREPECRVRLDVVPVRPHLRLQAGDERGGVAGGEASLQLLGNGLRSRRRGNCGRPSAEDSAEEGDGGGECRHRPCDYESRPHP